MTTTELIAELQDYIKFSKQHKNFPNKEMFYIHMYKKTKEEKWLYKAPLKDKDITILNTFFVGEIKNNLNKKSAQTAHMRLKAMEENGELNTKDNSVNLVIDYGIIKGRVKNDK